MSNAECELFNEKCWLLMRNRTRRKGKTRLHTGDGVHLNDLGQLAMAFVILKGLGAPSEVSSVTLDVKTKEVLETKGCRISKVSGDHTRFEFTRLDQGLPLNNGLFFGLNFRFVPIPRELNQYLLRVVNLPAGRYDISAEGRALGTYSSKQLSQGVNLSSATGNAWQPGGPWNVQADMLRSVTESRHHLDTARLLGTAFLPKNGIPPSTAKEFDESNARLEEIQRQIARPRSYRFIIRPSQNKPKTENKPGNSTNRDKNRSATISPRLRDSVLKTLPSITSFRDKKSDQFFVDMDVVRTGHPYKGKNAKKPHTGGHIYFTPLKQSSPNNNESYPAIYAVADGVISRIDYSFRLREMYEPALGRRVANTRYGIGLLFAQRDGHPVEMHYSIEPFIDPEDEAFYDPFILVKPGQKVRKGDVIARMYLPPNQKLAEKSHIHFNLIGGANHRFMAPAIFNGSIVNRFHSTWGNRGVDGLLAIPPCMGYRLSPEENPFEEKNVDSL